MIDEYEKASWDAGYKHGMTQAVKLIMQIYKTDQLRGLSSTGFIRNFAYHLAEIGPEWASLAKSIIDNSFFHKK